MGSCGVATVGISSGCSRGEVREGSGAVFCLLEEAVLFRQRSQVLMWFRPWLGLKRWHYAEHVTLYFSQGSACQGTDLLLVFPESTEGFINPVICASLS